VGCAVFRCLLRLYRFLLHYVNSNSYTVIDPLNSRPRVCVFEVFSVDWQGVIISMEMLARTATQMVHLARKQGTSKSFTRAFG
jgi:hypothetical protein